MLRAKMQGKTAPEWFAEETDASMTADDALNQRLGELHTLLEQSNNRMMQQLIPDAALPPKTAVNWAVCDSHMLAKSVGQQAVVLGTQSAALPAGYEPKLLTAVPAEKIVAAALETGMDAGIKTAAAGALKVAAEKRLIEQLPAGIPMHLAADFVCTEIENLKTLKAVANGSVTPGEAADRMSRSTAVMYYEMTFSAAGSAIGTALLGWIPVVGPVIGPVIGGTIGYLAGDAVGRKVHAAANQVAVIAKKAVKNVWSRAKAAVLTLGSGIKSGLLKQV